MSEILYNSWTCEVCDFSDYETGVYKAEKEDFKFGQILYLKNSNKKCTVVGHDNGNNLFIVVEGKPKVISKYIGYLQVNPSN